MAHPTDDDIAMPQREALERIVSELKAGGALNDADRDEIIEGLAWVLKAVAPGLSILDVTTQNPIHQVYFRAGLLAAREAMARFVEQGGNAAVAQSIRSNWWPSLGDDPGAPRLFDFSEIADEIAVDGRTVYRSKAISSSVEALPRAHQFLIAQDADEQ